jgi:molybdate transport system substrate-binding protein
MQPPPPACDELRKPLYSIGYNEWHAMFPTSNRIAHALCVLAAGFCAAAFPPAAGAQKVTVFAAASLKEALDEVARAHEKRSGARIAVSYLGSAVLARQIEKGAPADIFISADLDWMAYLDQRRLLKAESRVNLLSNSLVLIAPAASTVALAITPKFAIVTALGDRRLALADPDSVPAGKYAKAALEGLGVWGEVAPRVARAENVRAALALVARGEAPLGIVYRTDARVEPRVRVVGEFPAHLHSAIVYPAAIVAASRSAGAAPLLAFLRSPEARRIWERYGFGPGDR